MAPAPGSVNATPPTIPPIAGRHPVARAGRAWHRGRRSRSDSVPGPRRTTQACAAGRPGSGSSATPRAAGHRHLGERDEEAAIGEVVTGGDMPGGDLGAHEIAVPAFGGEIDRRRRPVFAALDLAQIKRGSRDGPCVSPIRISASPSRFSARSIAGRASPIRARPRRSTGVGRIALAARSRCRAIRCPRRPDSRARGRPRACLRCAPTNCAHDLGPLGVAEIHVVGQRQRQGADRGQVAPAFGHRLRAAAHRVGPAVARRAIGGERQRLAARRCGSPRRRRPDASPCCP